VTLILSVANKAKRLEMHIQNNYEVKVSAPIYSIPVKSKIISNMGSVQ